jgi:hypothetical protein
MQWVVFNLIKKSIVIFIFFIFGRLHVHEWGIFEVDNFRNRKNHILWYVLCNWLIAHLGTPIIIIL